MGGLSRRAEIISSLSGRNLFPVHCSFGFEHRMELIYHQSLPRVNHARKTVYFDRIVLAETQSKLHAITVHSIPAQLNTGPTAVASAS